MATLILSAVGRKFGGPIGGAVGAIAGQFVDQKIFGSGKSREGPRLKELDVQTSSYGTSVPAIFGRMRVAGTVIWSTDLIETRTKEGGGKGQPSTNVYSYSVNMAVALSSRPIDRIGRIWADGNLLRGAAGDLKVETEFRFYNGHGDQSVDPIIASAVGLAESPAHRDLAYAVFENLQLANYGNRIPQLTFEIYERDDNVPVADILEASSSGLISGQSSETVGGYALDGSNIRSALSPLLNYSPVSVVPNGEGFILSDKSGSVPVKNLVPVLRDKTGNIDPFEVNFQSGSEIPGKLALRHYDPSRDFQVGVQTSQRVGGGDAEAEVDFPAALEAGDAKRMADLKLFDMQNSRATISGSATLDSGALLPGNCVKLPDEAGKFFVTETEYFEGYQKISGRKVSEAFDVPVPIASPGVSIGAEDLSIGASHIEILDLPALNGFGNAENGIATVVVAAAGDNSNWRGANLSLRHASHNHDAGVTASPATIGYLNQDLSSHNSMIVDRKNAIEIQLIHDEMYLPAGTGSSLSFDAPLISVADELIRYGQATQMSDRVWVVTDLLRGCFGTEKFIGSQTLNSPCVLIERESLRAIDVSHLPIAQSVTIEATGLGDSDPVAKTRRIDKISLIPRAPVHGRAALIQGGGLFINWKRRPRIDFGWTDAVDLPVVEDSELYLVDIHIDGALIAQGNTVVPEIYFSQAEIASWDAPPGATVDIEVSHIGRYARSSALQFTTTLSE